jgi:nicotinate-nucleotide--dimethylbenzimidazole phosphoribosyltransferase
MPPFTIPHVDDTLRSAIQQHIDQKTKPVGALGQLEALALQIGLIQNRSDRLALEKPTLLVFAADHGIAAEGVSAYPAEVTGQMVRNFLRGGAAINIFCRQHDIHLRIVDAGVNADFEAHPDLVNAKMGYGTASFLHRPAMPRSAAEACLQRGAELTRQAYERGSNVIGFGEMGIGNTSSAAVLTSVLSNLPLKQCVGRGTGLDGIGWQRKLLILEQAVAQHGRFSDPLDTLATYGGYEIAQMTGAMLQAAQQRMIVLVDGFIATAAFLVANALHPDIRPYAVFCHQSEEAGHRHALGFLRAKPLLQLDLRLGEGTGCALAYPLLVSAVNFYNEMASFDELQ